MRPVDPSSVGMFHLDVAASPMDLLKAYIPKNSSATSEPALTGLTMRALLYARAGNVVVWSWKMESNSAALWEDHGPDIRGT